jgi:hypothetical protein
VRSRDLSFSESSFTAIMMDLDPGQTHPSYASIHTGTNELETSFGSLKVGAANPPSKVPEEENRVPAHVEEHGINPDMPAEKMPLDIQAPAPPREYSWLFVVPRKELPYNRYRHLSKTDEWYMDNPHTKQRVCARFTTLLDPTVLCRALHHAVEAFPAVAGLIGRDEEGKRWFKLDSERVTLQLIMVSESMLENQGYWPWVFERHKLPSPGRESPPLFQAFMLRSPNPSLGCALIVSFDHILGDSSSYAMFLRSWSEAYVEADKEFVDREACKDSPPDIYPDDRIPRVDPNNMKWAHRFRVCPQAMNSFKQSLRERWGILTTNDILMAQAAVALAPMRTGREESKYVRIALLADQRGRGEPEHVQVCRLHTCLLACVCVISRFHVHEQHCFGTHTYIMYVHMHAYRYAHGYYMHTYMQTTTWHIYA